MPVPQARPTRRMVQHALRVPAVVGLPHHLVVLQVSRHRNACVASVANLGPEALALVKGLFHWLWPFLVMVLDQIFEADRIERGSLPVRALRRLSHLLSRLKAARGLGRQHLRLRLEMSIRPFIRMRAALDRQLVAHCLVVVAADINSGLVDGLTLEIRSLITAIDVHTFLGIRVL